MPGRSKYGFDRERLKRFIALSAEKKLNHLEKMNHFLEVVTPRRSKRIWEELKKKGW